MAAPTPEPPAQTGAGPFWQLRGITEVHPLTWLWLLLIFLLLVLLYAYSRHRKRRRRWVPASMRLGPRWR